MTAVSKAFANAKVSGGRRGCVLGVVPCVDGRPKEAKNTYPNEWVEIPLYTHLPLSGIRGHEDMSRNHIIALTGDVVVALPGREGTLSEVQLAWSYGKPLFLFLEKHDEIRGLESTFAIENDFGRLTAAIDKALSKIGSDLPPR
jgi:predicted Rossmann-fold nucleotide-binding protein